MGSDSTCCGATCISRFSRERFGWRGHCFTVTSRDGLSRPVPSRVPLLEIRNSMALLAWAGGLQWRSGAPCGRNTCIDAAMLARILFRSLALEVEAVTRKGRDFEFKGSHGGRHGARREEWKSYPRRLSGAGMPGSWGWSLCAPISRLG